MWTAASVRECHHASWVNHLIQENVRSRSKYQPCLSYEQVQPALLIALTHEGRDSGLGVGNSCSFQLIFNYPSSHEGGYRRGRRVGVQTMRLATRHAIRAEVKLIKNRKWPAIIVVITQHTQLVNVKTPDIGPINILTFFLLPLR